MVDPVTLSLLITSLVGVSTLLTERIFDWLMTLKNSECTNGWFGSCRVAFRKPPPKKETE